MTVSSEVRLMPPSPCPSFRAAALNRRDFLRVGALGLYGLTLPRLLHGEAVTTPGTASRGRAKAGILLFMWGGPAQQDTWDMKPEAPVAHRGEFRPMPTTVPGLQICEPLP